MTSNEASSSSAVALAHQKLTESIRRGIHPPSSRLPGERELAQHVGVSRTTLRQALLQLSEEGVVHSSSQRGWFVTSRMLSEPPRVLQSFTEMARAKGLTPLTEVLNKTVRPSTFEEASKLAIPPSAPVLELRRRRSLDRVPVCVDTNVISIGVHQLSEIDFTDRSLYEILLETCGVTVARCAYVVQAIAASGDIVDLLETSEGSPILYGQEVTYDAAGSPISTGNTLYRGDAYRFQADLYAPLP